MKLILFDQLQQLAEEGSGDAQYYLARELECGDRIPRDYDRALKWYISSFSGGVNKAAVAVGILYSKIGQYKAAVVWYERGVERGDISAMWRLGVLCEEGIGCDVDYHRAVSLYEQACKVTKNDPRDYSGKLKVPVCKEASWRLGRMFDMGLGCDSDKKRALECYENVLCERHSEDWVRGPEWAELYFRYAELLKEKESSSRVLLLYEVAAQEDYPEAKNRYADYWLSHSDNECAEFSHVGRGASFIIEAAESGNKAAMRHLASSEPKYAWKLLRMGDKGALELLIAYYGKMEWPQDYETLKGRRLCAIIKNERKLNRPFRTAAKTKTEMLAAFASAVEFSSTSGPACYKIHQWESEGLITTGGYLNRRRVWLERAVMKEYRPAIQEMQNLKNAELEKCYADEIIERESGKNGQRNVDKAIYTRLIQYFTSRAENGNAVACRVLSEIFRRGDYGVAKDEELYKKWVVAAARSGDLNSMHLACNLKIESSDLYAIRAMLAEKGDEHALFGCAEMLEIGDGCARDCKAAAMIYEKLHYMGSLRRLYLLYSQKEVEPPKPTRIAELRLKLIANDQIDSVVAARNLLYLIFNEDVPVENLNLKIKKAVEKGMPLTYSYQGGYYSSESFFANKEYDSLFSRGSLFAYEPDISCLPGKMTELLLCIFGRELEVAHCKEYLSRLYSLSGSKDLYEYQKTLRDECVSSHFAHKILSVLDTILYSSGKVSRLEVDKELISFGLRPDKFFAVLKILELCGLRLREPFPYDEDCDSVISTSYYDENIIRWRLELGTRALLVYQRDKYKVSSKQNQETDISENELSDRKKCDIELLDDDTLYWLRRYSDKGDLRASYVCGKLYLQGACVEKNDRLAERYLMRCAETSKDAQYWLGVLYSNAQSCICNITKASSWLRKAYESGSKEAAHALGDLSLQYAMANARPIIFNRAYMGSGCFSADSVFPFNLESGPIDDYSRAMSNALKWFSAGVGMADPYSTFKYGLCLIQGLGCKCDVDKGLSYVEKASLMGCADAAVYIAMRCWCVPNGTSGERDVILRNLKYAKGLGDRRASALLEQLEHGARRPRILDDDDGILLSHWPIGVCNSGIHSCDMMRMTLDALLNDSNKGEPVAMFKAGCKLYNGFMDVDYYCNMVEIDADPDKAFFLFEKSAVLGYIPAITMLGVVLEKRMGFVHAKKDAYVYYRLASQFGDGYASWRLYKQRAEEFAKKSVSFDACQNGASALDNWSVGYCYEKGYSVIKDYSMAVSYYTVAVSRGFTPAMVSLGKIWMDGAAGIKRPAVAYALFSEAACRGDIGGVYFLGRCYEQGIGCEVDMTTAFMLYVEAARHGNASAKLRASRIAINHGENCCEYDEYARNAVVADAIGLPRLYFSILKPRYEKFDIEVALRELIKMGNPEATELLAKFLEQ